MNGWSVIIQDWLYPPTCLLCGDAGWAGRDLCRACAADLPYNMHACPRCGSPLNGSPTGLGGPNDPSTSRLNQESRPTTFAATAGCGACQRRPPAFEATVAVFRYEEPIRYLIHNLKFQARYAAARLLGELMADRLTAIHDLPQRLIPVPLHRARYRERGFNQSIEIAREISGRLDISLDLTSCVRVRATAPQTELSAAERARNIRRAFRVDANMRGMHVAILDDVVTTGATVHELARALRRAGAKRVDVWACARA